MLLGYVLAAAGLGLAIWWGRFGWWRPEQELLIGLSVCWGLLLLCLAVAKRRGLFDGCLLMGLVVVVLVRSADLLPPASSQINGLSGPERRLTGTIINRPMEGNKLIQVVLGEIVVEDSGVAWPYYMQVSLPLYSQVAYGDRLLIEGTVSSLSTVDNEGYRKYLENKHIYALVSWPTYEVVGSGQGLQIVAWGIAVQDWAQRQVEAVLPQDAASFLLGVVLGSDQVVSEEFKLALQRTGTTHIVVASGYNISLILLAVFSLSGYVRKLWLVVGCLLLMGAYLLISGFDPSIIRACVMASFGVTAMLWGRQRQAVHGLLVAAIVMLLINPWWLFEVGFQLSFMATLGLIMFQPLLSRPIPASVPKWLSEIVSSCAAAQVLVLPVLMVTFSTVSLVSLLTNTLILWLTPWLMVGGIVLLLGLLISSEIGRWLAYALYPWLWYVRQMVLLSGGWGWSMITVSIGWVLAGVYYALLLVGYEVWLRYRYAKQMDS